MMPAQRPSWGDLVDQREEFRTLVARDMHESDGRITSEQFEALTRQQWKPREPLPVTRDWCEIGHRVVGWLGLIGCIGCVVYALLEGTK